MLKLIALLTAIIVLPVTPKNGKTPNNNSIPAKAAATPDIDKLKQSDWYTAALNNLEQSEYAFAWQQESNCWSTPNRKNDLRFFYDENGFTVQPRTTQHSWKAAFMLDKKQVGKGVWQVNGNKAEYITDKITVQYINSDEGMRQNFIVSSPLPGDSALKINFSIKTKLKQRLQNNCIQLTDKTNTVVLNYDQLKVWDANGTPLEASFEKSNTDYCIQVNTSGAVYPVTIDPISTSPAITIQRDQASARLGNSIASAGDINGDGYSDIVVGAYLYDNGQVDEGAVFIYYGSATGITNAPTLLEINQADALMGGSVASAGDVNGDGYSDIIAGAYMYDNGTLNEGAAFVYHGSATGIITTPAARVESNQEWARLGSAVASAGDVNGDGYSDVLAGVSTYTHGETSEGVVFVYHGSASGINTTAAVMLQSNMVSAFLGGSVASAGDVNGDGYSDVIAGAANYSNGQSTEGAVFIYHGSATGINATAVAVIQGNQADARMGNSVSSAGDVNGDGYSDIIIGARGYITTYFDEGAAFIYYGSATGVNTAARSSLVSDITGGNMGDMVACAGDVNGDGYSDVLVVAEHTRLPFNPFAAQDAVVIFHGSATGITINPAAFIENSQLDANSLSNAASAGDVNGDGYSDIIIGVPHFDNGQTDEGIVYVHHGSPSGTSITAVALQQTNQVFSLLGCSVSGAGDVNGDGYSDIIVGAYLYDNGQADEGAAFVFHGSATGISTTAAALLEGNQANSVMGWSVAGAGDVNGDGYGDVVVGAPQYSNGQSIEGVIFIFHGSASGINTTAAAVAESNTANAQMGFSVAGAGDVNKDGYSDIIAGGPYYANGMANEGAFYIFHGSATGMNTVFAARVESNQVQATLGFSVASAGDVNGDGYSDVVVGAYQYDNGETNEGAAFIYHGSVTGINTTAAAVVQSNQAGALLGYSVACAGDVNGDGYSDIIVGAIFYDNSQANEGGAFVYHGSAAGINTTATAIIESNQADAELGHSVAGAGDVNGDGYSDVIVGAHYYDNGEVNEGGAFVYRGSAAGINTTAIATLQANQADARFGYSVAGAGDVNGDGYSDVLAGAYFYDNGESEEGAAFVYYGNTPGTSKRNNLKVYAINLTTPVVTDNFGAPNFGAGLFAKSFLGRSKGKLVWETRLNYNAYSGTPITNSTLFTAEQTAYTDLGLTGAELKNLIAKRAGYTRIRARVKYSPVTAITGQLYGPWRYVPVQILGNSLGTLPVKLISFTAAWQQKGKTAQIRFVTDSESEICCYEIEKSTDGVAFIKTGSITAKNTPGVTTYNFIDEQATAKKQYYRLKTIHNSGAIDYSNIQLLQTNKAIEILVFPNPTDDVLQLQLNNTYAKMNVQIVNQAGQLIKQYAGLSTTNGLITIPVRNLAAGTYFLQLQSGAEKQVLQFVKH